MTRDTGNSCDEYPFYSTAQGGPENWGGLGGNWVSLKLINHNHNIVQGSTLGSFYSQCGIKLTGDKFRVETSIAETRYLDNDRVRCAFKSVEK